MGIVGCSSIFCLTGLCASGCSKSTESASIQTVERSYVNSSERQIKLDIKVIEELCKAKDLKESLQGLTLMLSTTNKED